MTQYIFPEVYSADSDLIHTVFYICDKILSITGIKYDYIFKDTDGLVVAWDNNRVFLTVFNKIPDETVPERQSRPDGFAVPELYINVYDKGSNIYPKSMEHLYTFDKDAAVKILAKHLKIKAKL